MKVLHLRSTGGFYGAENVILHLASCNKDTVDSTVAAFTNASLENELLKRCNEKGIKTLPLKCIGLIDKQAIRALKTYLKENNIDILHTHGYKSTIIGWIASWGLKIKKVSTNHLWDFINRKLWIYQRIEGIIYNFFNHIVGVSEPVYKDVYPYLLNKKKLSVIQNGIDYHLYKDNGKGEEVRQNLGIKSDEILIGLIGRLCLQKGHTYLIKAAKKLVSENNNIKIVFWGQGALETDLKQQVKEYKLENNIIFAGVTDDMPSVYKAINILAMPSLSEGLPMTMLEAMAAGVPVVATSVGDIPKVIIDNETGFLIDNKDPESLANKIQSLLSEKGQTKEIALAGQKAVKDNFSAETMADKYFEIYKGMLVKREASRHPE